MSDYKENHETLFEVADDENLTFFSAYTFAFQSDTALSLQAKGLLAMLLSFGKGWKIYMRDIEARSSSGRYVLKGAVKELINAGYLTRKSIKGDRGRFVGWSYKVYQKPQILEKQGSDGLTNLPHAVKRTSRPTACGKLVDDKYIQTINNNNLNNKQQQKGSIVVEKLKEMKLTESAISEISTLADEVTVISLIAYAKENKLGAAWVRAAARDPSKRPVAELMKDQSSRIEFNRTSEICTENFIDKSELAKRATAYLQKRRGY